MKITSFFSVLALAMCLAVTSFAQKQNQDKQLQPRHKQMAENGKPGFKHDNLFTEEQKEAFKTIRLKNMKEAQPLHDQLRELKAHQQTLMNADKPDMNAIYANIDKISDVEKQLAKIKAKERVEIMSYLTDEQKLQMQHFPGMKGTERGHDRGPREGQALPGFRDDQIYIHWFEKMPANCRLFFCPFTGKKLRFNERDMLFFSKHPKFV